MSRASARPIAEGLARIEERPADIGEAARDHGRREGHLLVLVLEQELPPGRPLAETVAAARAQGALVIAPHTFGFLVTLIGRTGPLGFGPLADPA